MAMQPLKNIQYTYCPQGKRIYFQEQYAKKYLSPSSSKKQFAQCKILFYKKKVCFQREQILSYIKSTLCFQVI